MSLVNEATGTPLKLLPRLCTLLNAASAVASVVEAFVPNTASAYINNTSAYSSMYVQISEEPLLLIFSPLVPGPTTYFNALERVPFLKCVASSYAVPVVSYLNPVGKLIFVQSARVNPCSITDHWRRLSLASY